MFGDYVVQWHYEQENNTATFKSSYQNSLIEKITLGFLKIRFFR